jgi:hypothetical protein
VDSETQLLAIFTKKPIFTTVVKNQEIVNIVGAFEADALRILREVPGLTVVAEPPGADRGVDAIVQYAGTRTPVAVEFKQRANAATAWQLVHMAHEQPGVPLLLVAGQTTTEARNILQEHGVAIVDGLGNAHIKLPGLIYHLEGRRKPPKVAVTTRPTRLRGKAGIAAQALLLHPERKWHVGALAHEARVSAALAHRVLIRLEREDIVLAEGTGPKRVRRLANPTALVDLWAEENADRTTRTPAYLLEQTPQRLMKELGNRLTRGRIEYALTGAAAGSLVAPFITAVPVIEVWVRATTATEELHDVTGANPVAEGQNVVFLQAIQDAPLAFREQIDDLWVVNRFRLYADLRRDPRRGREQAEHLRSEVIRF